MTLTVSAYCVERALYSCSPVNLSPLTIRFIIYWIPSLLLQCISREEATWMRCAWDLYMTRLSCRRLALIGAMENDPNPLVALASFIYGDCLHPWPLCGLCCPTVLSLTLRSWSRIDWGLGQHVGESSKIVCRYSVFSEEWQHAPPFCHLTKTRCWLLSFLSLTKLLYCVLVMDCLNLFCRFPICIFICSNFSTFYGIFLTITHFFFLLVSGA